MKGNVMRSQRVAHDVRELKFDVRKLWEAMHSQGKELRAEINALRAEMNGFVLGLERFKWRFWAALTVLSVVQLLVAGGAPAAIVRALKLA